MENKLHSDYKTLPNSPLDNRLALLYSSIPSAVTAHLMLAFLFYFGLQDQLVTIPATVWLFILCSVQFGRLWMLRMYQGGKRAAHINKSIWLRYFRLAAFTSGLLWGATALLVTPGETHYLLFVAFVLAGINGGAMSSLAADRLSLLVFSASSLLPILIILVIQWEFLSLIMSVMISLFLGFIYLSGIRFRETLRANDEIVAEALINQQALDRQHLLSDTITRVQSSFIHDSERQNAFIELLPELLSLTDSKLGFISEINITNPTQPCFRLMAVDELGGNNVVNSGYIESAGTYKPNTHLSLAYSHQITVFNNDLNDNAQDYGLPDGFPPITELLLLPIIFGSSCIAILGLANKPSGYNSDDVVFLQPIVTTLAQLFNALRVQREHRLAQQELKRLSQVASQTINGVIITDLMGQIQWVNDGMTRISGYTREELLGQKPGQLLQGDDSDPVAVNKMRECFRKLRAFEVELINYHKSGRPYWIRIQANPMYDETGKVVSFMAIQTEITNEHEAQQALKHHLEGLAVLNQISSLPVFEVDSQLTMALELAADYLEMDVGAIIERDDETPLPKWSFPAKSDGPLSEKSFLLLKILSDKTMQHGDIYGVIESDIAEENEAISQQLNTKHSYIGIPVILNEIVFGTISFLSLRSRLQGFKENEKEFLRLFCSWVETTLMREQDSQRLKKLTLHIPGMVYQFQQWPDGRSCFPYSSPGIQDIYGTRPEAVEEDASEAFSTLHPDDIAKVYKSISYSRETLTNWKLQYRTLREGRVNWLEGEATPEMLADGSTLWHGYIKDITEQKKTELAVAQNELRLRRLFELSPVGIALNDYETGIFIDVNPAFLHFMGYSLSELGSMSYHDLTPKAYRDQEQIQLKKLEKTGQYGPYEKQFITKSGQFLPVLLHGMKVQDSSNRTLIWSIVEDISDRKHVEKMKNEFIATVSHELRTPLTSISGALDLLVSKEHVLPPETVDEMLNIAQKNSKRLRLLVDDLLDIEKLVAGKIKLKLTKLPVTNLIQEAIYNIQPYADSYDVSLKLIEKDKALQIVIDQERFLQVMNNLLSNAIKFSHKSANVRVIIESYNSYVRVSVCDEGIGISSDFKPHVFEKFAQVDNTDRRGNGGTGLGLAITQELVAQMGGTISFDSELGKGATFYVEFPSENPRLAG